MKFIAALLLSCAAAAHAQSWPTKPVRVVVAFAPGGSLDFVTRIISERLSQDLGQQFPQAGELAAHRRAVVDRDAPRLVDEHAQQAPAVRRLHVDQLEPQPRDCRLDLPFDCRHSRHKKPAQKQKMGRSPSVRNPLPHPQLLANCLIRKRTKAFEV